MCWFLHIPCSLFPPSYVGLCPKQNEHGCWQVLSLILHHKMSESKTLASRITKPKGLGIIVLLRAISLYSCYVTFEEIRRQLPPTRSISHHTCRMDDFTVCKHNKRGITHNWLLSDLSFSQGLTPGRPLPCQYVFASERLCELCPASHSSAIPPLSSLDFPTEP